jgi:hypothetical protein
MRRRLIVLLVLAGLTVMLSDLLRVPLGGRERSAEPDPLQALNQTFRKTYARARQDTLARLSPVVLVQGDQLVLLRDGMREEVTAIPARYHELKAVAHVPLALYVLLAPAGAPAALTASRRAELRELRALLGPARASLDRRGFDAEPLARQRRLLDESRRFLDQTLAADEVSEETLRAFTRRMAPLVLANAADAARLQIDGYQKQMALWRGQLSADEWRRLRIVVVGSAMPRRGNLAVQYFAWLLGVPGEGRRIIYAESLWEEPQALRLLGTSTLDGRIGRDFFDDDRRMHRDLLADAAAAYLRTLPAPK